MGDYQTGLIRRKSLVEEAEEILRDEIISGRLASGSRIPLKETAERLQMSGVPLREALGSLTQSGLVIAIRQRGYWVSEIDFDDMEDIYFVRMLLEPLATRMAVENMTDGYFRIIEKAHQDFISAKAKKKESHEKNKKFHFSIYSRSGSSWLVRVIEMLWDPSSRYQAISSREQEQDTAHAEVLEAIRNRNPKLAEEMMRQHIELTLIHLRKYKNQLKNKDS